jgi:alpha-beta hydrolase superfamily lysophospholipase
VAEVEGVSASDFQRVLVGHSMGGWAAALAAVQAGAEAPAALVLVAPAFVPSLSKPPGAKSVRVDFETPIGASVVAPRAGSSIG